MAVRIDRESNLVTLFDVHGSIELPLEKDVPLEKFSCVFGDRPVGLRELISYVGARAIFEGATEVGYVIGHSSGNLWLQSARLFFLPDGCVFAVESWKSYMMENSYRYDSIKVYSSFTEFSSKNARYRLSRVLERAEIVPLLISLLRRLPQST